MKLKILSDWREPYDSLFDAAPVYVDGTDKNLKHYLMHPEELLDGDTFVRICNAGLNPSRRWCFEKMAELGETVIPYARAIDLAILGNHKLVVYVDEQLHAGRGKYVMTADEVIDGIWDSCQDCLASKFIETDPKISRSTKYLQLGAHAFWIEVTSQNDWRTNAGQIACKVLEHFRIDPMDARAMHRCLWAIDYVTDWESGKTFAVDYNMAPGITSLGVKDVLTSTQIVNGFKDWYELRKEIDAA